MLRRAALLALAAALLACPSKVPKAIKPGAYVRVDSLGNPVVQVIRVEDGVLVCRQIPNMNPRRIPLKQIHTAEPVSEALVARMRSLARAKGGAARMEHQLNAMRNDMAAQTKALMEAHQAAGGAPTLPPTPQDMGSKDMAPRQLDQMPDLAGGNGSP